MNWVDMVRLVNPILGDLIHHWPAAVVA
jgi:hypothetical protein